MTSSQVGVQVDEADLPNNTSALQCITRTRSNQSAAANNANFHDALKIYFEEL
jgi:hypothetical protein